MEDVVREILREEAWRNERVLNVFRCVIWITMGVAVCGLSWAVSQLPSVGGAAAIAWGLFNALVVSRWLRGPHDERAPMLLSTLDIVVLAGLLDAVYRSLLVIHSPDATRELHIASSALLVVVLFNALRCSVWVTAWSTLLAIVASIWLQGRHEPLGVNTAVEFLQYVAAGAILVHAARKQQIAVRRVRERDAFARFLPAPAVERIARDPRALNLGGEEQHATVLFADVRDFTAMSGRLTAPEVVEFLNRYFAAMVEEIFAQDGILDKFIGDGICAVFAPPLEPASQACRAISCARNMLLRVEGLNADRAARGLQPFRIGIGIHTGPLVAGNIGSPLRMEYTHIGDSVNTASRIESLCKELASPLLVSDATWTLAQPSGLFEARAMPPTPVKGKEKPLQVHAIAPRTAPPV